MTGARDVAVDEVERLYERERARLVSVAWMVLGTRDAAEDAVQEAFATLSRRGLAGIDEPAAYLRTVVLNECRRAIRRRGRLQLRAAVPDVVHHDPELVDLGALLDRLTPKRRMAVVLRYHCDLPVHEVAARMGCAPSTVSSLLHRSMKVLKEELDRG